MEWYNIASSAVCLLLFALFIAFRTRELRAMSKDSRIPTMFADLAVLSLAIGLILWIGPNPKLQYTGARAGLIMSGPGWAGSAGLALFCLFSWAAKRFKK